MKKREYLVFNSVLVLGISLIFLVLLLSVLPVLCFAEETSIDKETLVNKETTLDKLSNSFGEKLGSKLGDKLNDNFEVNIILKDLTTNKPLTDLFVTYNIDGITSTIYLDTTSTTSAITLLLKKGTHNIEIRADDKNTPVIDYYGTQKFDVEFDAEVEEVEGSAESKTTTLFVSLYPVGLLRGFVKDKLDNIIPYADLKFECISNVIIEVPSHTDKFGFFKVETSPVGTCKILANYEEGIGISEVEVKQGELSEVTINLDKTLAKSHVSAWIILLFILIILAVFAVLGYGGYALYNILYKRYSHYSSKVRSTPSKLASKSKSSVSAKKSKESLKSTNVSNESLSQKTEASQNTKVSEAILKTLNSKEKAIVEFLLSNSNKASQAQIRHNTGIPRTSLTRVLQSLEAKKIIVVERLGKMVKVSLTDFFLGK